MKNIKTLLNKLFNLNKPRGKHEEDIIAGNPKDSTNLWLLVNSARERISSNEKERK